jgi:hypothetical protein
MKHIKLFEKFVFESFEESKDFSGELENKDFSHEFISKLTSMIDDLDSVTTENEIEGDKLKGELDKISKTLNNEFSDEYKEIEIYARYSNEESRSDNTLTEYVLYSIYAKSDGKDIECVYRCTI